MEKSSNNNDIEKRTVRVARETPLYLQYDRMKWRGMCAVVRDPKDKSKTSYVPTKYETCYECGFESLSYFNRTFKKISHQNPSDFKKHFRKTS